MRGHSQHPGVGGGGSAIHRGYTRENETTATSEQPMEAMTDAESKVGLFWLVLTFGPVERALAEHASQSPQLAALSRLG